MKCTSCVSARPKSSDDDEDACGKVSPAPTMDKAEQEYRVESPPPPLPERASRIPSVSIVELPPDYRPSPSPSGSSQLLRPLDVITEETSDVSDSENRPPPATKPDLCFPRPKPRFKKPKSKNLLKNLLRQEPTTCVLVDAKIAETSTEEYRSICTTEVVPEEILEVEVIDLGSNSSSLADLTDIDDLDSEEPTTAAADDKINNNTNEEQPPPPPSQQDDNDNELIAEAAEAAVDRTAPDAEFSEEDNNGYEEVEAVTTETTFTQPPNAACTQNDDDDDDDDDDGSADDGNDRTESDRDDREVANAAERCCSLAAGVDRVVTQRRNVNEVKDRCTEQESDQDDDCSVTHLFLQEEEEEEVNPEEEQEVDRPVIGESLVTEAIMGEEEPVAPPRPPPPIPMPPPPAKAAAEQPRAAVTNLGQDVHERPRHDAQIPAGSDTGEADPADADQNSEEDSGNAVEADESASESSVLLKLLQDQPPVVEKRPTFGADQISPVASASENPPQAGTKIERAVKSEQLNYEIVQDHRVLREETVTTSRSSTVSTAAGGSEVILRRRGSRNDEAKEPSPEQKAALVHDLRNEISRIKDAELQEEFRKLELEAARIEEELSKMAVVPPPAENLTYYVSKQNDFAVERPPPPRQKPPVVAVAPVPPPKPSASTSSVAKSSSSNDLMYNEWQAKMEEREARRLHKVVKISKTELDPIPLPPPPAPQQPEEDPNLGDEFLRKVKERRRKFTIPGGDSDYDSAPNSAPTSTPATPIAGRKPVPKHIEAEFAEFAEIRKRQQQEQEQEQKAGESASACAVPEGGRESRKKADDGDGSVGRRPPPSLLVLASAIGIVVWTVCRVLFGRE